MCLLRVLNMFKATKRSENTGDITLSILQGQECLGVTENMLVSLPRSLFFSYEEIVIFWYDVNILSMNIQ